MAAIGISGGDKLEAYLADVVKRVTNPGTLRVGFLEDATYPGGTPVAYVAAINNFGAPAKGIPPRPFFTNMVRSRRLSWVGALGKLLTGANYDATAALTLMGQGIAGQLKQAIVDMNGPANSPVTNLLKARFPMRDGMTFADVLKAWSDVDAGETAAPGKPLVWTGHMLNSVDYEIERGDG